MCVQSFQFQRQRLYVSILSCSSLICAREKHCMIGVCLPVRFSSKRKNKKKQQNDSIKGQQRPHIRRCCAIPAATSMKSRPGAGYDGPGVWRPKHSESSDKSVRS